MQNKMKNVEKEYASLYLTILIWNNRYSLWILLLDCYLLGTTMFLNVWGKGLWNKHEIHLSVKTDLCFVIVCHFDIQLWDMDFVQLS